MTSPTSHRRKSAPKPPAGYPPIPDGVIPTQRRPGPAGPGTAGRSVNRGKLIVYSVLIAVIALGAWGLLSPSGPDGAASGSGATSTEAGLRQLLLPTEVTPASTPGEIPDGPYRVGTQIQPGTYRTEGAVPVPMPAACRWQLGDRAPQVTPLLSDGVATGPSTVTIRLTDRTFSTSGCQTWTKVG